MHGGEVLVVLLKDGSDERLDSGFRDECVVHGQAHLPAVPEPALKNLCPDDGNIGIRQHDSRAFATEL